MIYFVDIDGTICEKDDWNDDNYEKSTPMMDRIAIVNDLYEKGNTVIYWTARGTGTGIDWRDVTERQFEKWGVKYHDLRFGKPIYDLFIDDRNIHCDTFFKNIKNEN
tara:strand:+ start:396 stop:716 length:321 start_codon:yes stop_codon:yes gene_type:complete